MPNPVGPLALSLCLLLLAGCVETPQPSLHPDPERARREAGEGLAFAPVTEDAAVMYAAQLDGGFGLAAVDPSKMNPDHIRQTVSLQTDELPGTIIVDQKSRFLYFVLPDEQAIRYAVGVGPDGERRGLLLVIGSVIIRQMRRGSFIYRALPQIDDFGGNDAFQRRRTGGRERRDRRSKVLASHVHGERAFHRSMPLNFTW